MLKLDHKSSASYHTCVFIRKEKCLIYFSHRIWWWHSCVDCLMSMHVLILLLPAIALIPIHRENNQVVHFNLSWYITACNKWLIERAVRGGRFGFLVAKQVLCFWVKLEYFHCFLLAILNHQSGHLSEAIHRLWCAKGRWILLNIQTSRHNMCTGLGYCCEASVVLKFLLYLKLQLEITMIFCTVTGCLRFVSSYSFPRARPSSWTV